jgi:hypothetical protein
MVALTLVGSWLAGAACGPAQKASAPPPGPAADAAPPADAAVAPDAGDPNARPFAETAAEATQLITDAIDKRRRGLDECVKQYRSRKHLAHETVKVTIGVDQEGHVLGVTLPKNKEDKELSACVQKELKDAPFPRSHAGVITITRSFSYEEVER